ncbi:MAG: hypothetical protein QF535_13890, partial [Anaerolineales bacterium]|nr:hypothetical protein [Anaerolineales bacterium]
AGATGALGKITMDGYTSDNLSSMMEKVTAGATGALGSITMDGYTSDNLSSMMEKVTAGATGALGNITMDGYTSSDLTGMMEKVTAGATGALDKITMVDADGGLFDSNDLSGMVSKIAAGATGALGGISMDGYSTDNASAFTKTITDAVKTSLSGITTDNLSEYITAGATAGTLVFLGSDNVTGTYSTTWGGATPSGGCINNDNGALGVWASLMPSATEGFKIQKIFTSSTSFTKKYSFYAEDNCSTETGYVKYGYKDITVGAAVTGLTAGSDPSRPTSAYKVKYSKLNMITKGNTPLAVVYLNTYFYALLGMTHTSGVEQTNSASGTLYDIWATGVSGSNTYLFSKWDPSTTTYPTDWTQNDDISFK